MAGVPWGAPFPPAQRQGQSTPSLGPTVGEAAALVSAHPLLRREKLELTFWGSRSFFFFFLILRISF